MIKKIILLILIIKILIITLVFFAYNFFPFNKNSYNLNFTYPKNEKISLISAYKTWDAQHYLFLSDNGYKSKTESARFFPLLPFSIKILSSIFRNNLISGFIASLLFSIGTGIFFYLFSKKILNNSKIAIKGLFLLFSFPTAFYLSLIYSEALFMFFTLGFFYFLYSKKFFLASIFAFFIPLTRPVGILIMMPYLAYWIMYIGELSKLNYQDFFRRLFLNKKTLYLSSPLFGVLVYFLIMQFQTGNYWEGIYALQNSVIGDWKLTNLLNPIYFFVNLFFPDSLSLHGFTNSIVDRVFFLTYCVILWLIYKKMDKVLFVYSLFFGLVPLFGNFMSYTRYVLIVFPIYILLAKIMSEKRYSILFYPILFFFIILQAIFLIAHALSYWIA